MKIWMTLMTSTIRATSVRNESTLSVSFPLNNMADQSVKTFVLVINEKVGTDEPRQKNDAPCSLRSSCEMNCLDLEFKFCPCSFC